ncbi:GNAT family N-acetyltransferase [Mycolicibacterium sp. S2-37]|uniref:GNAT family N-acetyltransferase n=1 Tax=Mycolicibacterium sp. S2-37 TaxID=2810297 RepID=UPI001A94AAF1|nr:GNAT family N-acetyltransferase [Mycolicibacterium sp. S2-37]MBO0676937.1 GNAT family N-acetyltransferase [Mycolicibacterium sp. S2-37]
MESVGTRVRPASPADLPGLADIAARTFPLACPPSADGADVAAFIAENLSQDRFADYLADPDRVVFVAEQDARILGYAMLIRGEPDDPDVARAVPLRPTMEVSKIYVSPDSHGAGTSAALMSESLQLARDFGYRCVWLGVNQENRRAQRFYAKHGFAVTGTKSFRLGTRVEHDYVMVCSL